MTLAHNLAAYAHIDEVLAQVVAAGQAAEYECDDAKAALRFRFAAYSYRKLLSEGGTKRTPYDTLVLRIDKARPHIVVIEGPKRGRLSFRGTPIDVGPTPEPLEIETEGPSVRFVELLAKECRTAAEEKEFIELQKQLTEGEHDGHP